VDSHEAKRKKGGVPYRIKGITSQLIRSLARKWTLNGAIRGADFDRCYYVNPGIQDEYKHCFQALLEHRFVLLAGARASGKTTRLFWLQAELEAKGYKTI
jgi:hypothetical protein